MNNFSALDSRSRRNLLAHSMNAFSPSFHKNYSIDTTATMKTSFRDSLFINTVHLIPEPMKMNLADSVVTLNDITSKTNMADAKVNKGINVNKPQNTKSDFYPSLARITNFFSGVFNVMGAIFQKRTNSPVQYYDCFEQGFEDNHEMTPSSLAWHTAKREDQNINGRAQTDEFASEIYTEFSIDMNDDFRSIAAHCEDKLNQVRLLLNNPQVKNTVRSRCPKRAFHEANSVDELFEDAFDPDDFISLANETFIECCSPFNHHHEELQKVDAPKVKTDKIPIKESTEIIQTMLSKECDEVKTNIPIDQVEDIVDTDTKRQIVLSCENKVSQLKALLKSRHSQETSLNVTKLSICTNNVDPVRPVTSPISIPNESDSQIHTNILFVDEVKATNTPESPCDLDPSSYFDEVTGRFYSSSATDSEDSFQIVFSDSPRNRRKRIPSDCESEDSFIVFEESADSCYTSNDVFGENTNDATNISDSEDSDSDCGSDLDSGLNTIILSHSLTKTFGDLTDGSLYEDSKSEDVVDCAFRSAVDIPKELIVDENLTRGEMHNDSIAMKRSLLLDDTRKKEKKKLPDKKVHFSPLPPKVHVMRVWAFAARQARAGHWERHALDRERFKRRIADVEVAVSWVLKPQHRSRVMFQRFMPWWNAQKRKEIAERKQKEEEKTKQQKNEVKRTLMEEERSRRYNSSDMTEVDEKEVADRLKSEERLIEVLKNVPEEVNERVEQGNNGVINANCTNNDINSQNVLNSDNPLVESTQIVGNVLGDVITSIGEEPAAVAGDGIVVDETGGDKLCNGDNTVHCKVEVVSDDSLKHRQIFNKKIIDHVLQSRNTYCNIRDSVRDDLKVRGGGAILGNHNALQSAMEHVGRGGLGAPHEPAS